MMEAAWRLATRTVVMPDWTEPFAQTIDAAKKYVVSSTLDRVDWNAELVRGDLGEAVQELKQAGHGPTLFAGLSKHLDLKLVSRLEFGSGAVALRYEPRRSPLG